ncbi:hypothetical protein K1719_013570 [Acacia pycnantha]|nr:hypothetical protein K1719_013570 [Acacia pycnantha]
MSESSSELVSLSSALSLERALLIAHGGGLLNLAKKPKSIEKILGAEKALFKALKTKHATRKYGLIYDTSLIGKAAPKLKRKISRSLSAKAALCIDNSMCNIPGDWRSLNEVGYDESSSA